MEEETIGLGFHSHRDAITGVASSMFTEAATSSFSIDKQQNHATTRFVSSSDSKLMSVFPPPPPHPSTAQQQQPIQSNDDGRRYSSQIQQPRPQEMHQNEFPNQLLTTSFQPPPGLPPQLSIPPTMAVPPPSQLPPPPIPLQQQQQQQQMQSQIIQRQQQNDSIAKARAIAQRFHTESAQPHSYISSINNNTHSNSIINHSNNNTNNNNIIDIHNYAQKRQQHFQNEKLKLQTATLKNLEYIMKHEESQLRSHVECMNEMTEWGERQEVQLQLIRQQKQKEKQERQVEKRSGGGIGSKDQRYVERVRKRQQVEQLSTDGCSSTAGNAAVVNQQQQQQQSPQKRTSIYLTNLPTDGSITERTLRSLFCVYGRLDRVTMYRNRSTGELKGDGLIVFGLDSIISGGGTDICNGANSHVLTNHGSGSGSGIDLVETVCMQMNGAELPCGTVIGVEPADMDWGRKDKKLKMMMDCHHTQQEKQKQSQATIAANSGEVENVKQSNQTSTKDEEEEENLDDFFASLE